MATAERAVVRKTFLTASSALPNMVLSASDPLSLEASLEPLEMLLLLMEGSDPWCRRERTISDWEL